MNWIDLIIAGTVLILALLGLKTGILMPASGLGGLALGIFLSLKYHGAAADVLAQYIEGDIALTVASYAVVVVLVAVATRIAAAVVKKFLSFLVLGWVDHVSGAALGAAVGLVLTGTASYLLIGAGLPQLREPLAESTLIAEVSQISLLSSSKPWCSQLADEDAVAGEDCNSLKSLAVRLASGPIKDKLGGLIGQDVDQLIEVVGSSLDGSTSRLTELTGDDLPSEEGLLGAFEALADKIKNVDVAEAVEAIREGDFDVDSALDALDEVLEGDLDVESALDALETITERDLDADSALDALDEVLEGGLDVESALDALETITERDLDADSALDALEEVLETDLDVESALDVLEEALDGDLDAESALDAVEEDGSGSEVLPSVK